MLDEYIKSQLLEPNGMHHSYWGNGPAPTLCYDRAGLATEARIYESFVPALGMKSCAADLLEFTKNNMAEGSPFGTIHLPRHPSGIQKNTWAAMGWHVLRHRKRPDIVTHTGSTAGHRATIAFVKETKTGVVILSNSPFGHNGLEFSILRMLNKDWKR